MISLSRVFRLGALAAAIAAAAPSFAVVATSTNTTPTDTEYLHVGQVNGASGVAVGLHQFLTAGHVGAGAFTVDGTTYTVKSSAAAPDYVDPLNSTHQAHVDLTLVTINETFTHGFYSVGSVAPTGEVKMVGYGYSGGVSTDGLGYARTIDPGTRHQGTNTVANDPTLPEPTSGVIYNSATGVEDGLGPYKLTYLRKAGDGIVDVGDSGGGWFTTGRVLVGITSFDFNLSDPGIANTPPLYRYRGFTGADTGGYTYDNGDGTGPHFYAAGTAYVGSGAIDLTNPQIQTWLKSQGVAPVPEPASWAVLGLGAAAMLRRRKK